MKLRSRGENHMKTNILCYQRKIYTGKTFMSLAIMKLKALKKQFATMLFVEAEKLDEELRPLEKLTPQEEALLEQFYSAQAITI